MSHSWQVAWIMCVLFCSLVTPSIAMTCTDVDDEIKINSLDQLKTFAARGCTTYVGDFYVRDATDVVDLELLVGLTQINQGKLYIRDNKNLLNLQGLRNLNTGLAKELIIRNNVKLKDLEGLQGITGIGMGGTFTSVPKYTPCKEGLCMYIDDHPLLMSLKGLRGITGPVPGGIKIQNNDVLLNLDGLEGITSVTGFDEDKGFSITIEGHKSLQNINALDNISGILPGSLQVWANEKLESLQGIFGIKGAGKDRLNGDGNSVYFASMPQLCVTPAERAALDTLCTTSKYTVPQTLPKTGTDIGNTDNCASTNDELWTGGSCKVCSGASVTQNSRTHSSCGVGLFCDYYGGGRCMCASGFAQVNCNTETSTVRVLKTKFEVVEVPLISADYEIQIPLQRTISTIDVTALELVEVQNEGTATPVMEGALLQLKSALGDAVADPDLLTTTLEVCQTAAAAAADYKYYGANDDITWTNGTHGYMTAKITVSPDSKYENKEIIKMKIRDHSVLYPDAVLAGPTEIEITIIDGEPGKPQFVKTEYSVNENEDFATVVLERVGGTVGAMTVKVSVDNVTSKTTATAGVDYNFNTAVVTWENDDASPKAVAIPLLDDNNPDEDTEYIVLSMTGYNDTTSIELLDITEKVLALNTTDVIILGFGLFILWATLVGPITWVLRGKDTWASRQIASKIIFEAALDALELSASVLIFLGFPEKPELINILQIILVVIMGLAICGLAVGTFYYTYTTPMGEWTNQNVEMLKWSRSWHSIICSPFILVLAGLEISLYLAESTLTDFICTLALSIDMGIRITGAFEHYVRYHKFNWGTLRNSKEELHQEDAKMDNPYLPEYHKDTDAEDFAKSADQLSADSSSGHDHTISVVQDTGGGRVCC